MQLTSRSSTSRKPVPTSNTVPLSPQAQQQQQQQLPPPPPPPVPTEPMSGGGGLKKSKSVRAKKALKTIANPIKTRREEKAKRSEVETAERRENEKNVQDFLATGRDYCERNFS